MAGWRLKMEWPDKYRRKKGINPPHFPLLILFNRMVNLERRGEAL